MRSPVFPYVLLFALGIALADGWAVFSAGWAVAVGAGLMVAAIAVQFMRESALQRWMFGLLAGLAVVCLGYARMSVSQGESSLPTARQCHEITIRSTPERTAHAWRAMAKVQGEMVMLYFDEPPRKGDRLLAYCQLREPAPPGNPHQFDFQRYLRRKGISRMAYLHREDYIVLEQGGGVVLRLRERVYEAFQSSSLTPEQRGIAEALVMGYDSDVDPETQRLYRNAGITHLLCVSGLHVGIMAMILASLLFWMIPYGRYYRYIKGLAQIAGIWAFALFTGLAPSTVRASVMFSFVIAGRLLSSQNSALNNIASAALFMLLAQPGELFDIGFQLSYAAVLGIVLFNDRMLSLWQPKNSIVNTVWELSCLSIVTQLTCTPVLLYHFHQFPPYFMIANIVIVPFAGLILGSCFVLALTAWWPWLFGLVSKVVGWELMATDWVTRLVSSLPAALIDNICFPWPMLVLSIVLLVALYYRKYVATTVLTLCLVGLAIGLSLSHGRQESFIVYATPRVTAMEHLQGHRSILYLSDTADISFQRQGYIIEQGIHQTDTLYGEHLIHYQYKTIYLVDRENLPLLRDTFPIPVDYLVMSETPWLTPVDLRRIITFDTLVITPNNSSRHIPLWRALCHRDSIPFHDLTEQGALLLH